MSYTPHDPFDIPEIYYPPQTRPSRRKQRKAWPWVVGFTFLSLVAVCAVVAAALGVVNVN